MLPLLMGLLQGLTEFLPVSSSGHLALAEVWLGLKWPGLLFEALLHLGTVASIVVFYRRRILALARRPTSPETLRLARAVLIASVPIALVGLSLKDAVAAAFTEPVSVALALIWTGGVLFWVGGRAQGARTLEDLRWWQAGLIGLAQALAIFPGVSRSGMTVAAALALGLRREHAAEFSLFLAVPAILGATLLQLWEAAPTLTLWPGYALGVAVAFAVGWAAIGLLLRTLRGGRLRAFAYYCWALAAVVLAWVWWA